MPFPSLGALLRRATDTFLRFPVPILCGLLATVVAIIAIDGPQREWQPRLLATAGLGMALSIALVVSSERRGWSGAVKWLAMGGLVLGLALLYLASLEWSDRLAAIRMGPLLVAGHLLAAAAPFPASASQMEVWQYNRFLFIRFLTAGVYAAVLWIGLCVALVALDQLFGMNVPNEAYPQLWSVMAFGFHPWVFLAGVPKDFEELDRRDDYPLGLKVFAQFILVPLVTVYLVILTAYLGKIILTRTWPSGWIGYLVSCVSAVGMLALLLVHPARNRADSGWVNAYSRWWFVAILPSLAMLLMAIGQRVNQYGITEPRYFLLVLALWMVGIALYYGLSAAATIKPIPKSLAVVILLTAFGPWSATSVSIRSQRQRFTTILEANGMGRAGAPLAATGPMGVRDRREMSAILHYLEDTHGEAALAAAMGVSIDSVRRWPPGQSRSGNYSGAARAMRSLGLEYQEYQGPGEVAGRFWANVKESRGIEVGGFEVFRSVSVPALGWIVTGADSLEARMGADSTTVILTKAGAMVISLELGAAVNAALGVDSTGGGSHLELDGPVVVEGSGGGYRARLILEFMSGRLSPAGPIIESASGYLLLTRR